MRFANRTRLPDPSARRGRPGGRISASSIWRSVTSRMFRTTPLTAGTSSRFGYARLDVSPRSIGVSQAVFADARGADLGGHVDELGLDAILVVGVH